MTADVWQPGSQVRGKDIICKEYFFQDLAMESGAQRKRYKIPQELLTLIRRLCGQRSEYGYFIPMLAGLNQNFKIKKTYIN